VERVAVLVGVGVKPRERLQRLDLGLVAAPGGGENLEFADEVRLLGFTERIAKRDLAKPALRRRRPVVRSRGETIGRQRILRAPDRFGFHLALGVTCLLVVQALIHMGVCLGLLPTKGLPLPFISYGGSSLVATLAATGLLLNVSQHSG